MGDIGARSGMLVVEKTAKIRRAYFAQRKSIKAICREFRVSRKVVRKVIRSHASEFQYELGRQPLPRIGPWRGQLEGLSLANEGKPASERLTMIRIFEECVGSATPVAMTQFDGTRGSGLRRAARQLPKLMCR